MALVTLYHPDGNGGPHGPSVLVDEKGKSYARFLSAGYIDKRLAEKAEGSAADKPLAEMSNKELEAEAERLGFKFPAAVNTKPERVAYIEAHFAGEGDQGDGS